MRAVQRRRFRFGPGAVTESGRYRRISVVRRSVREVGFDPSIVRHRREVFDQELVYIGVCRTALEMSDGFQHLVLARGQSQQQLLVSWFGRLRSRHRSRYQSPVSIPYLDTLYLGGGCHGTMVAMEADREACAEEA